LSQRDNISGLRKGNPEENDKIFSEFILDNSQSMVSIINRDYNYEKVSKAFSSAFKGAIKSVTGRSVADIWGAEIFEAKIKHRIDRCLAGKNVRYRAFFAFPGSAERHYEVHFSPVRRENGKVTHIMSETSDIEELACLKNDITALQREFRRTEAGFRDQLLKARHLEDIGILAGGISHDFNNILATISGYAELLRDDLSDRPLLRERAEKILLSVVRAQSLTDRILALSSNAVHDKTEVDINDIIKETLLFLRAATTPSIIFETRLSEETLLVFADPVQLFRAFLNLLSNSVQAMLGRGGILTVSTGTAGNDTLKPELVDAHPEKTFVRVSVQDTGIGMDKSTLSRIFEPFFSAREGQKGTGLGLTVVSGIIKELGGDISVSSRLNSGSVFNVFLPRFLKNGQIGEWR